MAIEVAIRNFLVADDTVSGATYQIPFIDQSVTSYPKIAIRAEDQEPDHAMDGDVSIKNANIIIEVVESDYLSMRTATDAIEAFLQDFTGTDTGNTNHQIWSSFWNDTEYDITETQSADDMPEYIGTIDFNFYYE